MNDITNEQLMQHIQLLERKIDSLLNLVAANGSCRLPDGVTTPIKESIEPNVLSVLYSLTPKQHCALQMVIRGASNREIATRFGVTEDTAKVYLKSIGKKLGVGARTQIAVMTMNVIKELSDDNYLAMTGGIPKTWDADYDYQTYEDDPLHHLYTGSRVKPAKPTAH